MKKNLTFLAVIAIIISACSTDYTKTNPVCANIADRFLQANDNVKHLSIHEFTVADSVSVDEELTNKINIFRYKHKKAISKYESFFKAGKQNNAQKWSEEVEKSGKILKALDSLKTANESKLSQTLYYCVKFSGYATMYKGKGINLKDWWATVSTDGAAINVQKDNYNLKAAMGDLLPGYSDILKSAGTEEVEP